MEVKYTHNWTQDMVGWKYVTILNNRKINGQEQSSQWIVWAKVYIKSLSVS